MTKRLKLTHPLVRRLMETVNLRYSPHRESETAFTIVMDAIYQMFRLRLVAFAKQQRPESRTELHVDHQKVINCQLPY